MTLFFSVSDEESSYQGNSLKRILEFGAPGKTKMRKIARKCWEMTEKKGKRCCRLLTTSSI
jgi:hypothetical protein